MAPPGDDAWLYGLAFMSTATEHSWAPAVVDRLHLAGAVIKQALARRASQTALQAALDELQQLRRNPDAPALERRRDVKLAGTSCLVISESSAVRRALAQVEQVAPTSATVLLLGETGAGKEVFAQTVHDLSPRHRRPMVVVNCAAIPTALIESELFGRERGAYTGALSRQIGRFEAANQSTLLLDEIGELSADMQVKLLRVLEDHTIERLGSPQPIKIDVRIIAATHRDLEKAVRDGTFRQDLFYRLNVFPVTVPPLRERIDDVPGLVWTFVDEFARAFGKTIDSISRDSMAELQRYPWPGNVRELRNVVERAVILATDRQLAVPLPAATAMMVPQSAMTLATLEVEHIRSVLESTNWRVRGHGGAAERLGLKPTTLESRMSRFGILRPAVPA
jgi:transcriptional regulator with GAF, ATPase, and Fis domain